MIKIERIQGKDEPIRNDQERDEDFWLDLRDEVRRFLRKRYPDAFFQVWWHLPVPPPDVPPTEEEMGIFECTTCGEKTMNKCCICDDCWEKGDF